MELVEGGILRPCRALDIGCGTGTNVVYLATKGFEAHGLDISRVALFRAVGKARAWSVKCHFHHLDFTHPTAVKVLGEFGVAIDVGCYHSLSPGMDRRQYLRSLDLVLKGGGLYLLWCLKRGRLPGPPGVDEQEVERTFRGRFEVLERRSRPSSWRDALFYLMRKVS